MSGPHADLVAAIARGLADGKPVGLSGRLEGYDQYDVDPDGNEWVSHTTYALHLDDPVGEIVMVELEDLFEQLRGRSITLIFEESAE